jgi:hypothetical protein
LERFTVRRFLVKRLPGAVRRLRRPGLPELVCAALALACLVLPEWWTVSQNHLERQAELSELLRIRLEGTVDVLRAWSARLRDGVTSRAARADVEAAIARQAALIERPDELRGSVPLARLRQILGDQRQLPGPDAGQIDDFLVVTRSGQVIASSSDDWVGRQVPLPPGSVVRSALEGEPAFTPLGGPDLNLILESAELENSILVAAPVRGPDGDVLAALFCSPIRRLETGSMEALPATSTPGWGSGRPPRSPKS